MSAILSNLRNTVIASVVLAVVVFLIVGLNRTSFDINFFNWLFRYFHVAAAIMWIGLLWYFNFVQIPSMPKIPDEQKPAIGKVIAPAALFYFRWAAMVTLVTGLIVAHLQGYLVDALMLGQMTGQATIIGVGMWLAIIMWFNVWFVIWPNQKKALGIVQVEPDVKAKAARTAMLFSRTNTLLSLPMLLCMVGQMHLA
jgi:uncharacterized membrane protein